MKDNEKTQPQLSEESKTPPERGIELKRLETDLKRATEIAHVSNRFLTIATRHREMVPLLKEFVAEVQNLTGCAAVGFRLLEEDGKIPYQAYEGFSKEFYESENPLSINSTPCRCADVIKGVTNLNLPFYTEGGSFYMNGTTGFLASLSEEEREQTCCLCNRFG